MAENKNDNVQCVVEKSRVDDRFYGSSYEVPEKTFESAFDTLPLWMTHGDDTDDDSETLDPASDGRHSVCGGSDDASSSCESSSPAEQLRQPGAAADAPVLSPTEPSVPLPCFRGKSEEFVDLDLNEQRRRGDLLFAMIKSEPQEEKLAPPMPPMPWAPPSLPTSTNHGRAFARDDPGAPVGSQQALPSWRSHLPAPQLNRVSSAVASLGAASLAAAPGDANAGSVLASSYVGEAVREAAHRAFGFGSAEVTIGEARGRASSAYIIRLHSSPASEVAGLPRAKLDAFGRTLRASLGRDVVSFEQNACGDKSGASSHMRIMLRNQGQDACWDFARRGMCPRGGHCTWPHKAETVFIEITS